MFNNKKSNKNPSQIEQMLEMGTFYMMNKKYTNAVEILLEAVKIEPNNANVSYQLGLAYEATNHLNEAIDAFQRTLEISPEHKLAKEHLERLMGIKKTVK